MVFLVTKSFVFCCLCFDFELAKFHPSLIVLAFTFVNYRKLLCRLLTSATSIKLLSLSYKVTSLGGRSPRVRTLSFSPSTRLIYSLQSSTAWTSLCLANSSNYKEPYIRFVFLRPEICRLLPSDSASRWTLLH